MKLTKVLIADDHPLIAEGLEKLLGPNFQIFNVAADEQQLLKTAQQFHPDIIVMDSCMPNLTGGEGGIKPLLIGVGSAKLMILATHAEPTYAARAISAGVSAFVLKHSAISEISLAFNEVMAGRTFIATELSAMVAELLAANPEEYCSKQSLTPRQIEVLQLFAQGYSAKEVARILFISKRTAENHKATIKRLLGVNSTAELVKQAIQLGLVSHQ